MYFKIFCNETDVLSRPADLLQATIITLLVEPFWVWRKKYFLLVLHSKGIRLFVRLLNRVWQKLRGHSVSGFGFPRESPAICIMQNKFVSSNKGASLIIFPSVLEYYPTLSFSPKPLSFQCTCALFTSVTLWLPECSFVSKFRIISILLSPSMWLLTFPSYIWIHWFSLSSSVSLLRKVWVRWFMCVLITSSGFTNFLPREYLNYAWL